MGVIAILILISLAVALLFLAGFIWAVRSGQFEDTFTPSLRILMDEPEPTQGSARCPQRAGEPPEIRDCGALESARPTSTVSSNQNPTRQL